MRLEGVDCDAQIFRDSEPDTGRGRAGAVTVIASDGTQHSVLMASVYDIHVTRRTTPPTTTK